MINLLRILRLLRLVKKITDIRLVFLTGNSYRYNLKQYTLCFEDTRRRTGWKIIRALIRYHEKFFIKEISKLKVGSFQRLRPIVPPYGAWSFVVCARIYYVKTLVGSMVLFEVGHFSPTRMRTNVVFMLVDYRWNRRILWCFFRFKITLML